MKINRWRDREVIIMDERGNMLPRSERIKMLDEAGLLATILRPHWSQFNTSSVDPRLAFVNKDGDDDDSESDSDDDSDDDKDGDDDDDDDDADDNDDSKSKGKKGKKDKGRSSDDDDDDDDDAYVRLPRQEAERMRRENRDLKKEKKQKERDARTQREKDLAENEQFKALAEERQERIDELETEVEELKGKETSAERAKKVRKVAKRLGFADPDDAHLYLSDDEMDKDDKDVEKYLSRILEDKTHLKGKRKGSGAPIDDKDNGGGGGGDKLTMEEIENMSQDEVNKNWDKIQPVLAANRRKS